MLNGTDLKNNGNELNSSKLLASNHSVVNLPVKLMTHKFFEIYGEVSRILEFVYKRHTKDNS